MARKKKGRSLKKNRQVAVEEGPELIQAPHSFVLHRGLACPYIQDLTKDFRRLMEPFTAISLKERKSNKIKDFIALSSHFHVTHMCIFNKASTQLSFKVVRLPRGPTLTYKVHQFTLGRDVITASRKQFFDEDSFKHAPLVILNNFTGEGKHLKLMATTFQNMFPTINLATVNLATMKRCILISYNPVTNLVDMRHYSVIVTPVGLSKGVKKVVLGKVPNLSRCEDIADLFTRKLKKKKNLKNFSEFNSGAISDSEFEDDEASQVVLPQDLKRKGNLENNKSAIRLYELGPRVTMELVKIEDGLLTGEVLHHEHVVKTEEEVEAIRKQREKKKKLKEHRKKIQEENKAKKERLKNATKVKPGTDEDLKKQIIEASEGVDDAPDDDIEYYRQEIGEEPEEELFRHVDTNSNKRVQIPKFIVDKRRKLEQEAKRKSEKSDGKRRDNKGGKHSVGGKKFGFKTKANMKMSKPKLSKGKKFR